MRHWGWVVLLLMGVADAAPLTGRLTDAVGQPVTAAPVWCVPYDLARCAAVSPVATAADGSFTLTMPAGRAGGCMVLSRVVGRGCAVARVAPDGGPVALVLRPGGSVDGVVLDEQRQPVAGATVWPIRLGPEFGGTNLPPACGAALWSAVTDAQGRWRLDDLPPAEGRVLAVHAAGRAARMVSVGPGPQPSPACCALLPAGELVRGRMLLPDGQPAAGVRVSAGHDVAITAADGSYALALEPGPAMLVIWRPDDVDWAVPPATRVVVTAGAANQAPDVALLLAVRVTGTVVDELAGTPLAGCRVLWLPAGGPGFESSTDDTGHFGAAVAPGDYTVLVLGAPPDRGAKITVAAGQPPAPLVLRAPLAGQRVVRLQLVDPAGRSLAHTPVAMVADSLMQRVTTDDRGGLTVRLRTYPRTGLPDPPSQVSLVLANPFRTAQTELRSDQMTAELSLTECRTTTVSGTVRARAGAPLAGADVVLSLPQAPAAATGEPSGARLTATTRADGTYLLTGVPMYLVGDLSVAADGCTSGPPLRIVASGAERRDLVVERATAAVSGCVVDAAGQPVAGAMLLVPGCLGGATTLSAADGGFRVTGLPCRSLTLLAMRGQRELARVVCTPPAADLRLTVASVALPDWSSAPTAQDRADALRLARQAVRLVAARDAGRSLAVLACVDPGEALAELARRQAGPERDSVLLEMLRETPPDVRYGSAILPAVQAVQVEGSRAMAAWLASRRLRPARRDLAAALYELASMAAPPTGGSRLEWAAALADMAQRAESPAAEAATAALVELLRAEPHPGWLLGNLADAGPVSPRLLAVLLPLLGTDPAADRLRAAAVSEALRTDPQAAWALARGWWPGDDGGLALPERLSGTGINTGALRARLAVGLLPFDAARARALLDPKRGDQATFTGLLSAALLSRDAASARGWLEAASRCRPVGPLTQGSRLALAAAVTAPDLAERCRQEVLAGLVVEPKQWDQAGTLSELQALALCDPNRARCAIEAIYGAGPTLAGVHDALVLAMAAVDVPRALAMAQDAAATPHTCLTLARWLMADRTARCSRSFATWLAPCVLGLESDGWH